MLQSQGQRLVVPSLPRSAADRVIAAGGAVLLQIVPGVDEIDPPPQVVEELLQRPIPAPGEETAEFCHNEYKDLHDYMVEQGTLVKDYDDLK